MPAGLPSGKPGKGLEMEGAMQQAAQPGRQFNLKTAVDRALSAGDVHEH
jgi:hypothetical protein